MCDDIKLVCKICLIVVLRLLQQLKFSTLRNLFSRLAAVFFKFLFTALLRFAVIMFYHVIFTF